jgi:hypothetical protein
VFAKLLEGTNISKYRPASKIGWDEIAFFLVPRDTQ